MISWELRMFLWATVGSTAGLLWPFLIKLYKTGSLIVDDYISRIRNSTIRLGESVAPPTTRTRKAIEIFAIVFIFMVVALVIATIAVAVGFAAFLQDAETRVTLQKLGALGYFSAFTYGFSSASFVEEAMK